MEAKYAIMFVAGALFGLNVASVVLCEVIKSYKEQIKNIKKERDHSEDFLRTQYVNRLKVDQNAYRVEIQETKNRYSQILQEISDTLGVDEVVLPSFGKLYLNRNKYMRERLSTPLLTSIKTNSRNLHSLL